MEIKEIKKDNEKRRNNLFNYLFKPDSTIINRDIIFSMAMDFRGLNYLLSLGDDFQKDEERFIKALKRQRDNFFEKITSLEGPTDRDNVCTLIFGIRGINKILDAIKKRNVKKEKGYIG